MPAVLPRERLARLLADADRALFDLAVASTARFPKTKPTGAGRPSAERSTPRRPHRKRQGGARALEATRVFATSTTGRPQSEFDYQRLYAATLPDTLGLADAVELELLSVAGTNADPEARAALLKAVNEMRTAEAACRAAATRPPPKRSFRARG
jgi:hypothetical protein